jgi:alpha-tubulin suppressor-like RCC1 family protein
MVYIKIGEHWGMRNFVIAIALLALLISCKQRASSELASTFDDSQFYYWTNEDRSILYRGICRAGFEQDIGLCFNKLSWIDLSDISFIKRGIEIDEKKIEETLEEVALIREYDADKPSALKRGDDLELWAQKTKLEVAQRNEEFARRYGPLLINEAGRPQAIMIGNEIQERFRNDAYYSHSIVARGVYTCTLLDGGEVKCWGSGNSGQLGRDSAEIVGTRQGDMAKLSAVQLGKKVVQLSGGGGHNCALLEGGEVKCWGHGSVGQLGQDSRENIGAKPGDMADLRPVYLGKTALQVSVGISHTCALLGGGEVKCWGSGNRGQLGRDSQGDIGDKPGDMAKLEVVHLGKRAIQVSAGVIHTCALLEGGEVKCWGKGDYGLLGQDSAENIGNRPGDMAKLRAVHLGKRAVQVSAGYNHTCALLEGGEIKCWGNGDNGRLGQDSSERIGNKLGDMVKLGSIQLGEKALQVSAGQSYTCALLKAGDVKCWGNGWAGKLGQDSYKTLGNKPGDMTKLNAIHLGKRAMQVSAGENHTCALLEDGEVKCWGYGKYGQLGQDSTENIGDKPGDMEKLNAIQLGAPALIPEF